MQHYILLDPDLIKATHVKAYFRKDPKTGKLVFVKDYQLYRHKHIIAEVFHKGDKVTVDNPRSKFHGQTLTVRHYSPKYGVVRLDIAGQDHTADFDPRMLKPFAPAILNAATLAPKPVVTPASMTLDDAKKALGLVGVSFSHPDMLHERKRVESMTAAQLAARVPRIKADQKLYNFLRALNEWGTADKRDVAKEIEKILVGRAVAKQSPAPVVPATPAPAPKSAAPSPPQPPPTPKATFDPGDKVRINNPRSKHHGKEGEVTSFSDKYNVVRMKLADGSYTDASPASVVNLSGVQPAAQAQPVPPADPVAQPPADQTAPEPTKPPEPPKAASDFPHDKAEAWKHSTEEQRSLARVTGMVPLDPKAAGYIKKNLSLITARAGSSGGQRGYVGGMWRDTKTRTGYTIPQYVNSELNSNYRIQGSIHTDLRKGWEQGRKMTGTVLGAIIQSEAEWAKAGYDPQEPDLKKKLHDLRVAVAGCKEAMPKYACFSTVNDLISVAFHLGAGGKSLSDSQKAAYGDKPVLDVSISEMVSRHKAYRGEAAPFDESVALSLLHTIAGPDHAKPIAETTMRNVVMGLYEAANSFETDSASNQIKQKRYLSHVTAASPLFRDAFEAKQNYGSFRSKNPAEMFDLFSGYRTSSYADYLKKMLQGSFTTGQWASAPSIFSSDNAGLPMRKAASEIMPLMQGGDYGAAAIRDQWAANRALQTTQRKISKNWDRKFVGRIYPKGLIDKEGPRAVGVKIARQSGEIDDLADNMSKRYWKEVEKQKKLKAAGVKPSDPAKKDIPPPNNLGCTFRSVDEKTEKFIKNKIAKTWDTNVHGGFRFKIHGIYQIGGMDLYPEYKKTEDKRNNPMFGYHSTNFTAASGIVKSAYRPSRSGMLGAGVYVTDVSSKSAQYLLGDCRVTRTPGTRGVFLINKISLGKVHDKSIGAANKGKYESPSEGASDTIFAPKNKRVPGYGNVVLNDEHVVKDAKAVIPMYWVDMELTDRQGNTP